MSFYNPFAKLPEFPTDEQLEEAANECHLAYMVGTFNPVFENVDTNQPDHKGHRVRVEPICEWLLAKAGYDSELVKEIELPKTPDIMALTEGHKVFGYTNFKEKKVYITDKKLTSRFCWPHELKHALGDSHFDFSEPESDEYRKKDHSANKFARYFCLPKDKFLERGKYWQQYILGKKPGKKLTEDEILDIFRGLAKDFQVSGMTIVYRAKDLGKIKQSFINRIKERNEYIFPYAD